MLRPGMLADLVVLNRDPYECPARQLEGSEWWRRWSAVAGPTSKRTGIRRERHPGLLERRAEQLAGGIYGTIVVAGLLAAAGPDDNPEVWPTALWVVVTVLVFWLAHSWSLSIAHPRYRHGR